MIARASQLFLPTLRDDPADAEAVSHKLLVRGGFIRQVTAGLWTFMPLGWRVHRKVEQIIREEMDAIGAQEMLMPVLTPAELWETTGRSASRALQAPGPHRPRLRPAADARGDGHLPRPRDPVLQGAAADLVPPPDQGPRRAAAARRPAPRPRVHHEGRLLVRPRRGRARRELPEALARRTSGSSSAAGSRPTRSPPSPGSWAAAAARTSSRRPARARTRSSPARTATTRPTSRSREGRPSHPDFPEELPEPEEVETPGSGRSRTSRSSSASTPRDREGDAGRGRRTRRARARPRRRPAQRDEAPRRARRELPAGGARGDPRGLRRERRLDRPGRRRASR